MVERNSGEVLIVIPWTGSGKPDAIERPDHSVDDLRKLGWTISAKAEEVTLEDPDGKEVTQEMLHAVLVTPKDEALLDFYVTGDEKDVLERLRKKANLALTKVTKGDPRRPNLDGVKHRSWGLAVGSDTKHALVVMEPEPTTGHGPAVDVSGAVKKRGGRVIPVDKGPEAAEAAAAEIGASKEIKEVVRGLAVLAQAKKRPLGPEKGSGGPTVP